MTGRIGNDGAVKAFAFDLGNVLLPFDLTIALRRLAAQGEGGPGATVALLLKDDLAKRLETGKISVAEFFEEFRRGLKYRGSYEEFAEAFSDMFRENPPMVKLMRELKRRFPVYLLSNTNEIHIGFVEAKFPFLREFDGRFYSYLEGVAKPDPRFYHRFLERYHLRPGDVAFIDDILTNVEGARAVGMKGVYYQSDEPARAEMLRLAGL
jgi:epoxide hydrolase-like predicted phosphatase